MKEVRYFIKGFPAHFPGVNLAFRQLLCDYVLVSVASRSGAGSIINVTELERRALHINLSLGLTASRRPQRWNVGRRDCSLIKSG